MKGRLLTLASLLSLLLTFVVVIGWIRSHLTTDVITHTNRSGGHFEFATLPGQFRMTFARPWREQMGWHWYSSDLPSSLTVLGHRPIYSEWYPLGFAIHEGFGPVVVTGPGQRGGSAVTYRTYAIPYYLPLALTLVLPTFMAIRLRRALLLTRSRLTRGLCPLCGYDLRGSPDRCPECGKGREDSSLSVA